MTHLWEITTCWFERPTNEYINSTFPYKSWKEFQECKPYKLWKPYILSSWSWKKFSLDEHDRQRFQKQKPPTYGIIHIYSSDEAKVIPAKIEKEIHMLQIVFISPERFAGLHRVEMYIEEDDEASVRDWLLKHMPHFWKL